MLTDGQIERLRQYPGPGWISALCHDAIRKLADGESVQMSLFDTRAVSGIPDKRLARLQRCASTRECRRRRARTTVKVFRRRCTTAS